MALEFHSAEAAREFSLADWAMYFVVVVNQAAQEAPTAEIVWRNARRNLSPLVQKCLSGELSVG